MSGGQRERPGLEAQRRALAASCRGRGWELLELREEAGRSAEERTRPGSQEAQRMLGRADRRVLLARKRERPAHLLLELACLLQSAQRQGWALISLDYAPEARTPAGEAAVSVLAGFAPGERGLLSERIRQALARKRAQGVRLGRPPTISPHAIERIRRERQAGKSLAAIANGLNADHIPTAQGCRRWYPATIRYTLTRAE